MVQSKGLQHCRDIHNAARVIHKAYNYNKLWEKCLLEALRNHRLLILDVLEAEGRPLPSIFKQRRQPYQEQQQRATPPAHIQQQMCMRELNLTWQGSRGDW